MKWWLLAIQGGIVFVLLLYMVFVYLPVSAVPTHTAAAHATTTLTTQGFVPSELYVARGGTVVFVNESDHPFWPASNLHPDHSIYAEFDPREPLDVGESWSFTFEKPGTWGFHDHVRSYYTGVVHVSE
jgi:plastocyanin